MPFSFFPCTRMNSEKENFPCSMGGGSCNHSDHFPKSAFAVNFPSPLRSGNIFYKSMFSLIYTSFHEQAKFFKGIYSASYK